MEAQSADDVRVPEVAATPGALLESELVDYLYANLPTVLAANLINGSILAALFSRAVPMHVTLSWWLLVLGIVVVRAATWLIYRKRGSSAGASAWRRMAIVGAAASGVVWGAAGWLFFLPSSQIHYAALAFVLGGMAAGSLAASAAILASFLVFLYLSLLPFLVRLALTGDLTHLAMTGMGVLFVAWFTLIGRRSHDSLVRSLTLRHENEDLVRTLEQRVEDRTAQLGEHARRQESVVDFGQHALAAEDIEPLMARATGLVAGGLGVEYAAVLEPSADGRGLKVRCAFGLGAKTGEWPSIPNASDTPSGLAYATGEAVACDDLGRDGRFRAPPLLAEHGAVASLDVAIGGGGARFGVLHAASRAPRRFSAADIHFAGSVATMLAAAIDKQRALDEVQHMALHDALTDLPNRVLFRDHLAQALARFRRSGEPMAVILLDLDGFKDVNDTMGHLAGDRVLSSAAKRLISCVRETDQAARVGGDEFALILTDLRDPMDASVVAAKIVAALSSPFPVDERRARIGVSIGIAICPDDGDDPDVLLRNADLALYRAKGRGGNSYEFHNDALVDLPSQPGVT